MSDNSNNEFPILQDYVIISKLGSGKFGNVYQSFKKANEKNLVAIKVFQDSQDIPAIAMEVDILRRFKHENILELIEYVEDQEIRFLVLEYCDGGTLRDLIRKYTRLNESLTGFLTRQLIQGLIYLNSLSICHMDLKPENLLLNVKSPFHLKIADFGMSLDLSTVKTSTLRDGTVQYMAPEKLLGLPFGLTSDLWSVGIIIRECLTGRPLFCGYTTKQIKIKIQQQSSVKKPTSIKFSVNCQDILKGLLKVNPENRIKVLDLENHPFLLEQLKFL